MGTAIRPNWKPNLDLAVGKDATVQQFIAAVGADKLEIELAPSGEGKLRVNGVAIAQVSDKKDRRAAFRALKIIAERYLRKRDTLLVERRAS